ncbi:hypothetical protein C2S52_011821 [Perilla frutescens var. hirtella]|nr:hypothetical protein C2S52_011821 [Perilla frutescens var. hirtella]
MTKKNQQFSWRNMRDEELGFTANTHPNFHGEASGVKDDRRQPLLSGDNLILTTPQCSNGGHQSEQTTGGSRAAELTNNRLLANDELYINPSETPGMSLTADVFDGKNYHTWCRSVKRGLLSRNKLSFIDGTLSKPALGSLDYMQWMRVDYIVFNWITNSMTKEISRGFHNYETSKDLWDELQRRFGKKNGPRIYKLRRDIATFTHHNQSVMIYFNNLSSLWDDLSLLKNSRACTCDALIDNMKEVEEEKMMQFLMGLNKCYEGIRQQILILDPLPTLSQAYAMVLQVEEQVNVSLQFTDNVEQSALYSNNQRGSFKGDRFKKRLTKEEKSKLKCEHCGGSGHLKQDCFELIGIPDWYHKFKAEKGKNRAHCVTEQPDSLPNISEAPALITKSTEIDDLGDIGKLIQKVDPGSSSYEFTGHFAFGVAANIKRNEWIVDSGARTHMCCHVGLLTNLQRLQTPLQIYLPDGSSLWAFITGRARINAHIHLDNVIFAPEFTHNLLSVGQLTKDLSVRVQFLSTHYIIKEKTNDQVLGICKLKGSLYVFPHESPHQMAAFVTPHTDTVVDLHRLLGHPSHTTMKHILSQKRLPSGVLHWASPYEILFGSKPDISTLHPFGCLVFQTNTLSHKAKFDSRCSECIFLAMDDSTQREGVQSAAKDMAYDNDPPLSQELRKITRVLKTPDFQSSKAADDIRQGMKLLMELYQEMTEKPMKLEKCSNGDIANAKKPEEHQQDVKREDDPLLDDVMAVPPADSQVQGTYIVGGSAFGWNFITYCSSNAVYYGRTKEAFRAINPKSE